MSPGAVWRKAWLRQRYFYYWNSLLAHKNRSRPVLCSPEVAQLLLTIVWCRLDINCRRLVLMLAIQEKCHHIICRLNTRKKSSRSLVMQPPEELLQFLQCYAICSGATSAMLYVVHLPYWLPQINIHTVMLMQLQASMALLGSKCVRRGHSEGTRGSGYQLVHKLVPIFFWNDQAQNHK